MANFWPGNIFKYFYNKLCKSQNYILLGNSITEGQNYFTESLFTCVNGSQGLLIFFLSEKKGGSILKFDSDKIILPKNVAESKKKENVRDRRKLKKERFPP